jgi:hypothetical protein
MTKKFFISLAGILSVSAVSAQAGVIDFTQPGPQPLTGSIDGLTYVVTAGNDSITTNNTLLEQSQTGTGTCGAGLSCTTDGFGVGTGGNRDELDGNEVLTVSFENGSVQVSGFYVLDLYTSRSGDDREHGQYSIDGGDTWTSFSRILLRCGSVVARRTMVGWRYLAYRGLSLAALCSVQQRVTMRQV